MAEIIQINPSNDNPGRGQITIPKKHMVTLGWNTGDSVELQIEDKTLVIRKIVPIGSWP